MGEALSLPAVFAAGVLSFLSPCVLPLVSSYLVFLSGNRAGEVPGSRNRGYLIASTLSFILGFSAVFIVLSVVFSLFMFILGGLGGIINVVSGVIVIVLGLNMLFNFIAFLNYERRWHPLRHPRTLLGSFAVGLAFGAGWTPCIGPILGSILLLAGQSGRLVLSVLYLAAYSLGLALPFMLAALFWDSLLKRLAVLRSRAFLIQKISGVFLVSIGLLMTLGRFKTLNAFFLKSGRQLAALADRGGPLPRFLPALVFFLIALVPHIAAAAKRRPAAAPSGDASAGAPEQKTGGAPLFRPGPVIISVLFLVLAILQAAGLIQVLALAARWLSFAGI
ncbi:MAG: cytochrome c biogenesis protein CcdA [Treponema sp.]|jgi:cytochrome c-type biogenesis protein|nr:cytochrome c biogenesis protein CcdA [Treponema sp.]